MLLVLRRTLLVKNVWSYLIYILKTNNASSRRITFKLNLRVYSLRYMGSVYFIQWKNDGILRFKKTIQSTNTDSTPVSQKGKLPLFRGVRPLHNAGKAPFLAQSTNCCSLRATKSPLANFHAFDGPWVTRAMSCQVGPRKLRIITCHQRNGWRISLDWSHENQRKCKCTYTIVRDDQGMMVVDNPFLRPYLDLKDHRSGWFSG